MKSKADLTEIKSKSIPAEFGSVHKADKVGSVGSVDTVGSAANRFTTSRVTKKGRLFLRLLLMNAMVIGAAMLVVSILFPWLISNHIYDEKERELIAQGKELGRLMLDLLGNETDEETALYILDAMDRFLEARIWLVDQGGIVFLASEGRRGPLQQERRRRFPVPERQQFKKILAGEIVSSRHYMPHFDEVMLSVGIPISADYLNKKSAAPHCPAGYQVNSPAGYPINNLAETTEPLAGALFLHTPVRGIHETIVRLRGMAIITGLAAVILAAIPALILSKRFSRPLVNMKNAALKMAGGEFSHRVPVTANDELGQLGDSLNYLAGRLDRHEKTRREFIENVSHELRTPVTAIRGFAASLQDGTASTPEAQQKYLKIISAETERMGKLIADLLDLSRLESGVLRMTIKPFGIEEAVAAVVAGLHPLIEEKNIRMNINFPSRPGLPPVNGDRERIEQVLYILLDNAISFTPPAGIITVGAVNTAALTDPVPKANDTAAADMMVNTAEAHIAGLFKKERDRIIVYVRDTGPGIPAAELPFIWERFYRVDKSRSRSRGGTGLGLSIARQIMAAHGETINAANNTGGGAIFYFSLPV